MNGREKKNGLLFSICISFFFMACLSWLWLYTCRQAAYEPISAFCRIMVEANPETEQQVFSALKEFHALTGPEIAGDRFLASYGYTVREFCKGYPLPALALSFALLLAILCVFLIIILRTDKKNRRRIDGLTDYLEQVNADAGGTVLQMREDDFSRLQDELYKTVTALRQTREDAVAAKKRFAENLENIAHQLKTPITAACLSLELMKRTYPDAHAEQIEKQLGRLNRLEESLLTLSKIDAGTLPFCRTTVDIYTALTLAAENVSGLLQKENVSVSIPDNGCVEFSGDLEWTMEALKTAWNTRSLAGLSTAITPKILCMPGSGFGMRAQALTLRTSRTCLNGFTGADALREMASESVWPSPAPSLHCRMGRLPPIIVRKAAPVSKYGCIGNCSDGRYMYCHWDVTFLCYIKFRA